jgi:hypothetical protein
MRGSLAARWSAIGLAFGLMVGPVMGENAAHDIANRFAGTEPSVKSQDDEQRKTYEAEMLERARQEAADRSAEEQKAAADAETRQRVMEVQRETEAKALAERLKSADEARKAKAADAAADRPFKPALTHADKSVKSDTATASTPIVVTPCRSARRICASARCGSAYDGRAGGQGRCTCHHHAARTAKGRCQRTRQGAAAADGAWASATRFTCRCGAGRFTRHDPSRHGAGH